MYEELLNIIYTYTINKKVPDDNFIDSIISIIIKEEKLIEYVKDIDYNYQNIALDRKSTRLNSSHKVQYRMPSSA